MELQLELGGKEYYFSAGDSVAMIVENVEQSDGKKVDVVVFGSRGTQKVFRVDGTEEVKNLFELFISLLTQTLEKNTSTDEGDK